MTLPPTGKQVSVATHFLKPSFKFSNGSSTGAFANPGTGNGGDGGDWAVVPNGFYTMSINPNLRLGMALNVPFGLKTQYECGMARSDDPRRNLKSKTINFNPSLAYKVNDQVSIGGGVSVQHIRAELTAFTGTAAGGDLTLTGNDTAYGYNVGMVVQATPATRFGSDALFLDQIHGERR